LESKDINCRGCHSQSACFVGCAVCPIRKCCSEKSFGTCADCDKYDGCDMLKGFFSFGHQKAKENLDKIRASRSNSELEPELRPEVIKEIEEADTNGKFVKVKEFAEEFGLK
jgi:hypothetical protein